MDLLRQPGAARTLAPPAAWWLAAGVGVPVWALAVGDPRLGFAIAGIGLLAVTETVRALVTLSRRRRAADAWLRSAAGDSVPPRYAWRARQLLRACERQLLATTLRVIVRRSAEGPLAGFGALRLTGVSENREALQLLASTLERVDHPVTPAGMLRVIDLLTDGAGPLWNARRGSVLEETIFSALAVLRGDAVPANAENISLRAGAAVGDELGLDLGPGERRAESRAPG